MVMSGCDSGRGPAATFTEKQSKLTRVRALDDVLVFCAKVNSSSLDAFNFLGFVIPHNVEAATTVGEKSYQLFF